MRCSGGQVLRSIACAAALLLGCRPVAPSRPGPLVAQSDRALSAPPACQLSEPRFGSMQIRPGDSRSVHLPFGSEGKQLELLRGSAHARVSHEADGLQLRGYIEAEGLQLKTKQPTALGGYLLTRGPLRLLSVRSAEQIEVELIDKPQLVQPTAPLRASLRCADLIGTSYGWNAAPKLQDLQLPSQRAQGNTPDAPPEHAGSWYLWGPVKSRQQLAEFWDRPIDWVRDTRWERSHRIEVPLSLTPAGPPVAILRGCVQRVEVLAARGGSRLIALEEKQGLLYGWVPENELLQRDAPLPPPPPPREEARSDLASVQLGSLGTIRLGGFRLQPSAPSSSACDSQIELEHAEVRGPLAGRTRKIEIGIALAHGEILRCFEKERQHRPTFEAELQIALTVEASGFVRTIEVNDPAPGSATIAPCISQALKQRVRLPLAAAESTLLFPLRLQIHDRPRCLGAWVCRRDVPVFVRIDKTHHEAGLLRARTPFETEPSAGAAMVSFQLLRESIKLDAGMELALRSESLKACSKLGDWNPEEVRDP